MTYRLLFVLLEDGKEITIKSDSHVRAHTMIAHTLCRRLVDEGVFIRVEAWDWSNRKLLAAYGQGVQGHTFFDTMTQLAVC